MLISAALLSAALPDGVATAQENGGPVTVETEASDGAKVQFWMESSLKRVYPSSKPGTSRSLSLLAPRNGQVSFQACVRNYAPQILKVTCSVRGADGLSAQVRRVGYVPLSLQTTETPASELEGLDHTPGLAPDPLFPDQTVEVGPYTSMAYWVTVRVPPDASPGRRNLTLRFDFQDGKKSAELQAALDVSNFVVKPRKDFPVIHWFRGEALWDWYKTGMWEDEKVWQIHRYYMENLLSHGTDVIMVPIFFGRRETFQRPCQLLIVNEPEPGK